MKHTIARLLSTILCIAMFAGCSDRDTSSSEPEPPVPSASSEVSNLPPESISEFSATPDASTPSNSGETDAAETAVFSLGWNGSDQKTLHVGDAIGDWTLEDLQISYDDTDNIKMLDALFTGDVTLTGILSRSALMETGFDFRVAKDDETEMPCYIAPEMPRKDEIWFTLTIPEDIASTIKLDHGEELQCKITISDYRFIFAYMMAPASATVVDIEEIS